MHCMYLLCFRCLQRVSIFNLVVFNNEVSRLPYTSIFVLWLCGIIQCWKVFYNQINTFNFKKTCPWRIPVQDCSSSCHLQIQLSTKQRDLLHALHTTVCGPTNYLQHAFIWDMQHRLYEIIDSSALIIWISKTINCKVKIKEKGIIIWDLSHMYPDQLFWCMFPECWHSSLLLFHCSLDCSPNLINSRIGKVEELWSTPPDP